jgi:hypothetical protein
VEEEAMTSDLNTQRFARPSLHEAMTVAALLAIAALPIVSGLVTGSWIVTVALAILFWPSLVVITVKSTQSHRWPRIVGGPSVSSHQRR